jgi:hypothetical protein
MNAVLRLSLAVVILLGVVAACPASAIPVVAHEMKLLRSKGRVWKHSDGWLARMVARDETVDAEFGLPDKLAPGKYHFFVKANNAGAEVRLACGGGVSSESCPLDNDWNGLWSDPIPLEVADATESLSMSWTNKSRTDAVNFILQGLYITDRADVVVNANDCIVRRGDSAASDRSPPIPGNLLPNSSFEAGLGQGWLLVAKNERRDYSSDSLWDGTEGFHGQASLKVPAWASWISTVLRIRPDRMHTFSVWAKADAPQAQIALELSPVHQGNKNRSPAGGPAFPLTNQWQRLTLGGMLRGSEYQIRIRALDRPLRIDALQLEEGEASPYAGMRPIEVGLLCDKPAHLFFEDEPVSLQLRACNGTNQPLAPCVSYEVYDYRNRRVHDGSQRIEVAASSTYRGPLDLPPGRRGCFRVVLWAEGQSGPDEEVVYAVVPRPQRAGPDPSSLIGAHVQASDFQYEVLQRLGVKWTRILSPEAWFRWHAIEPAPGQFVWHDAEAEQAVRRGFQILGTIGTNEWPKWAYRAGQPDLDAWEQAVGKIVGHYRRWVKHWEVWNEPIHSYTAEFYAEMLRRAGRAIRAADPEAKIVGLGGSYRCAWCVDVIERLGGQPREAMDFLSTHLYPAKADPLNPLSGTAAAEFREKIIAPHKLEVWNTEAGAWCQGFYQGAGSGFRAAGEPVWPYREAWRYYRGFDFEAVRVAQNFLHSVGNGFTRYFYYDTRFHSGYYAAGKSHCTIFDLGDTIRTKGVAYAILARLFDHSRGLGNVSPDPKAFAYLFDRGGTPVVALFAADDTNVTHSQAINLELAADRFKAYDLMGNELAREGSSIPFGRQPVYLEGRPGLTVGAMRVAIRNGRIDEVPDRSAPRVSISDAPRGTSRPGPVRIRWIAVDDVAIPLTLVHRDALQYSHRLAGRDDSWSAWTAMTRVDYDGLAPGHYRFEVRARDVSGNVSEPATREFAIGESIRRRAAGPQPMRAATLGPELTPNYSRLADN